MKSLVVLFEPCVVLYTKAAFYIKWPLVAGSFSEDLEYLIDKKADKNFFVNVRGKYFTLWYLLVLSCPMSYLIL